MKLETRQLIASFRARSRWLNNPARREMQARLSRNERRALGPSYVRMMERRMLDYREHLNTLSKEESSCLLPLPSCP